MASSGPAPSGGALPGAASLGWSVGDGAAIGATSLGDLYRCAAVLDAERRHVLQPSWTLVASAAELPPGHWVTAAPGGAPVVVVRHTDGGLRAFHNLCRHRGMPLAEGSGEAGPHLTCPYHQWTFDLDGALVRIPQRDQQFAGIEPATLGLHPVAVAEWQGMIFVAPGLPVASGSLLRNVDPSRAAEPSCSDDAARFVDALGPLVVRLAPWWSDRSRPLDEVALVRYEVACNWKLLVENHVDVYHLWYLHQRSLAAYEHRSFEWAWEGDTWWSYEPLRPSQPVPDGIPGLGADERRGIGAHLLWPNTMIVTTADYIATYDAEPLAPDRTAVTLRVRSVPDAPVDELVAGIRSFLAEDIHACEQLQSVTGSPRFALGPLASGHEAPVRRFHEALRTRLLGGGRAPEPIPRVGAPSPGDGSP